MFVPQETTHTWLNYKPGQKSQGLGEDLLLLFLLGHVVKLPTQDLRFFHSLTSAHLSLHQRSLFLQEVVVNAQLVKVQRTDDRKMGPRQDFYIINSKAQETLWKRGQTEESRVGHD